MQPHTELDLIRLKGANRSLRNHRPLANSPQRILDGGLESIAISLGGRGDSSWFFTIPSLKGRQKMIYWRFYRILHQLLRNWIIIDMWLWDWFIFAGYPSVSRDSSPVVVINYLFREKKKMKKKGILSWGFFRRFLSNLLHIGCCGGHSRGDSLGEILGEILAEIGRWAR